MNRDDRWQDWLKVIGTYFSTGEINKIDLRSDDKRYYASFTILEKTFSGLLDSGATTSVVSKQCLATLSSLGIEADHIPEQFLSTADGTFHSISLVVYLPIEFTGEYRVVKFYVMEQLNHQVILGMNFFEQFGLEISNNFKNKEMFSSEVIAQVNACNTVVSREELTDLQKSALDSFVREMSEKLGTGIGRTHLLEHDIDTSNHLPVCQRQYPFAPPIMKELEAEIENMLADDIIEPSHSAWRSPVLLVKKASGQNRLCLDSRQLNKVTKKDSYPLPRVSAILDSLKDARYLSTIDLRSAFWQIPLNESSKEKTAFGLPGKGLYHFKVMPFGLSNASQTQQRLMDRLFPPEFEGTVFTYLDDIVICNNNFEEHLSSLKLVMNKLEAAGLTVNTDKCEFARSSLKYLGYLVDKEGLRTDPEKISAIINYPRPTTFTELKRFIGMASWYRRFVENFAMVASPLHELTKEGKKGKRIVWNEEAETAFINLKTALTSAPILNVPDFSREFSVQCDASNKGTGAVLFQTLEGAERPIAYTSRKLTERESKYSASERELLSVLHAVEQFRPYIEGSHFKVISDHSALQWLHKNKDPHGRLARWAMRLQQFDYEIVFRKGKHNVVPDALSRALDMEDISVLQIEPDKKDDWYKTQEEKVTNGTHTEDWQISQNRLWKYLKLKQFPDEKLSWKLVVPESLRISVLKECHDNPSAGHLGVKKTVNRVRQHYYWPSLIADVKQYVRHCEICASHKSSQLPPSGMMGRQREVTEPFQIVSMDLMGPFPRSKQGNTMLLVVSCWFSKFSLLFPLRNGKTSNIVKILEEQIILVYGPPGIIICDNGKQFVANQFKDMARTYDIDLWYTPYYHPQSNPTERVNKVIGTAIACYVKDNHKEWDKYIHHIGHAIRTAVHEVTGKTPSYLFFGRETSVQRNKCGNFEKEAPLSFNRERYEHDLKARNDIYSDISERLKKAHEENAKYYNKRRRTCAYQEGDMVWKRTKTLSNAAKGLMSKLSPKYEKAIIAEKVSTDVYKLVSLRGKDLGKWHSSDLKRMI